MVELFQKSGLSFVRCFFPFFFSFRFSSMLALLPSTYPAVSHMKNKGERRREPQEGEDARTRTPLRAPVSDRAQSAHSVGESDVSHKSARAGLRSADRNNKATLPLTRPGKSVQSYAKDLSPPMVKLQFAGWSPGIPPGPRCQPAEVQGPKAYSYPTTMCGGGIPAFWHGF